MKAVSILLGIVVAVAGFEAAATAWLTLREGKYAPARALFSQHANTFVRDTTRGTACRYGDTLFPHPYVAFVHAKDGPCGIPHLNNIGLFGDDFPSIRRSDRYVILLTGGSVASQLGQVEPKPAPRYLEEELNARYISPTRKPFLVLNGGDGAWKQPQQMILFSLYADSVDAVVTLDGYNEQLLMSPGVTSRFELPGNNFLDANPLVAQDGFGGLVVSWLAGRAAALLEQSFLSRSHGAYLLSEALVRLTINTDSSGAHTFWKSMTLPQELRSDQQKLMDWQLGQYRKYIRVMNATARLYGVKAMFFLQPVPALGKTLTEEEARATPDTSYGERYAQIVRDLEGLRGEGIAVQSLLDVFATEKRTIYADSIHAYRDAQAQHESPGYRLMAARMAREMAEGWGLQIKD